MTDGRVYIGVIGPGAEVDPALIRTAELIGSELGRTGAVVVTGGLGGVMAAAARGATGAGGTVLGLLPGPDRSDAAVEHTITVPTGLGELRNGLVVRSSDALICVGLSWGTLTEVALAVRTGVPVVTLGDLGLPLPGPIPAATPEGAVQTALAAAARRGST